MYSGMEEIMCDRCSHQEVCSLKGRFNAAQKAVDDVFVTVGERSSKRLRDFDWIRRVKLECTHFEAKWQKTRDVAPSESSLRIGPGEINCRMENPE